MAKERRDKKGRLLETGEYQRSDGRYMYRYTDSRGESKFVYSWTLTQTDRTPKGKKKGECLRVLKKEIMKDIADEIDWGSSKNVTLNKYFDVYIENRKELKTTTRSMYKYMWDKFIRPEIGTKSFSAIKYSDIKKFYNHLIYDVGFKPNTVETVQTILSPLFDSAIKDGFIRNNPTRGVIAELKRGETWDNEEKIALSIQEQDSFLQYVKDTPRYEYWYPFFVFVLGTGCRMSEAAAVTWDDCDFENDTINIDKAMTYKMDEYTRKNVLKIHSPKTKTSIRAIPMLKGVKQVLLQRKEGRKCVAEVDGISNFVFVNKRGRPCTGNTVNQTINEIISSYNSLHSETPLPHFSVHTLRHTFCTRLCETETNLKVIQKIMGHSSISTTMDVYNNITDAFKAQTFMSVENSILRL